MNMTMQLENVKIIDPINGVTVGTIEIDDATIAQIVESNEPPRWTAVPGFIDIHIHGVAGADVMDATEEALSEMARALVKEGTTSFLATTMTQSEEAITEALKAVAHFDGVQDGANCVGVHLEGPYVSKKRAGAQPLQYIIPPNDEQFMRWQQASGGKIRIATVAGEVEGATDFIARHEKNVIFSLGHTDATYTEMLAAKEAGAQHITHLYNQMSPFVHRDIHSIGTALLDDHFYTELIVDGIHSSPQAVQIAYKMKTAERLILITDAMRAKQMSAGEYELGGQKVIVTGQDARLEDGTLAGSIVTMEQAVQNMRAFTNCSDIELVKMSSYNAAKQLGLNKGRIAQGFDADLTIVDENWNVVMTIVQGCVVYKSEQVK